MAPKIITLSTELMEVLSYGYPELDLTDSEAINQVLLEALLEREGI